VSCGAPCNSTCTLHRYFKIAKAIAGITRRCRVNDLRHTFASNLATNGCNLVDIRAALAHTSTRMSERYAKPSPERLEAVRAAINRATGITLSTTHVVNQ
jgi:site-specific recombinase XerD